MKGFWNYFWFIYMLFFAIPFPMLIYYNTEYGVIDGDGGTAPWLALTWLAVSAILWIILIQGWFRKWIILPFIMRGNILRLLKEGVKKNARVLTSKELPAEGKDVVTREITCSLENFCGTGITEQLTVNDTKPELNRYDVGKTIQLLIDGKLKAVPHLTLDGVTVGIKAGRIIMMCLAWLLVVAAIVGYYVYSYMLENHGRGWRFMAFYHPLLLCPLILLVSRIGFGWLLKLFIGTPDNALQLKYYGLRTDAQIVSAEQTGTYINEQPQVRFELRYQDDLGKTHTASLKKIVPLLDLGMTRQESVPVFYLKENPQQVAFASDIEG
ncbi:hypothetical protein SAMN05660461_5389 [Chitinophaga ginsengisegetis]|uniref:Uncharacterized protein n=1 Tax=Chitinophaga ginsengisegetis TaxID=393003 RepID=A0A1T5P9S0_9BACT|nr:hypothetical protein [Chitinophaga ginsengisegetis]SKD09500.1 hypothetical protein SAMN05660461_5389 [Chitinophaga ginsengisegetis]